MYFVYFDELSRYVKIKCDAMIIYKKIVYFASGKIYTYCVIPRRGAFCSTKRLLVSGSVKLFYCLFDYEFNDFPLHFHMQYHYRLHFQFLI